MKLRNPPTGHGTGHKAGPGAAGTSSRGERKTGGPTSKPGAKVSAELTTGISSDPPSGAGEPPRDLPDRVERGGDTASRAARALAVEIGAAKPRGAKNRAAQSASFGAKLMSLASGKGVKKALLTLGLGVALLGGAVQTASADVIHVGQRPATEQAAQRIAAEMGEPYVHVKADKSALEEVLKRAEAGELKMTHLILSYEQGKLPSSWEWSQLKQQYPNAFKQVERVHVIGHDLAQNPLQSWQGSIFENARGVVSFDLATAVEHGPASAFVLEQTTKALAGVPTGLSPQDALIHAKTVAGKGAAGDVRTRVDIGQQHHVQAPENVMSEWLDARAQETAPITRAELESKLRELHAQEGGITDGMLGVLQWRLGDRKFKVDYDAARLSAHVVDIRRAAGPQRAIDALLAGEVHQVRHQLAIDATTAPYAQERSPLFNHEIARGVPMTGDAAIPTQGIQGTAYLVDGLGVIRNGEVQVQAIRHPSHGDGYQLTFKLGDAAGHALELHIAGHESGRLIDKTIVNHAPTEDGRVVTVEKTDAIQATATLENQQPEMSVGPALRLEKAGVYRVDYFPESISKQSLRSEVQLQVYGATDAERNARLGALLDELGLAAIRSAPSPEAEQKLIALRLLEQADPRAHHALLDRIEQREDVTIARLHDALVAAEVPPAFLQQAYFAEASPGHISVIVPGQSEAYARRGVRAIYHTVSKADIFAFIAADGALMSTKDRLQVGKVFRGMSSDTDLRTGGADFVFTRQVTAPMGNPDMYQMRGGAIVMKPDVLDRADWFAYSGDQYGTTLAGDRGEPTEAVKALAQRTFDEMKARGDPAVQGQEPDAWLKNLIRSQIDSREDAYLTRPVGRHQVSETTGTTNETMLEGTIPLSQIEAFLVRTAEDRDATVAKLKELGVHEIGGVKVEDFVQVREKFFTEEQMKKLEEQPLEVQPGDKVGDELKDKRLQFYVRNNPQKAPGAGDLSGTREYFIA
jgi:hypothetical protein